MAYSPTKMALTLLLPGMRSCGFSCTRITVPRKKAMTATRAARPMMSRTWPACALGGGLPSEPLLTLKPAPASYRKSRVNCKLAV